MEKKKVQDELTEQPSSVLEAGEGRRMALETADVQEAGQDGGEASVLSASSGSQAGRSAIGDWFWGFISVKRDALTNLFNMFPSIGKAEEFAPTETSIAGREGAVIQNEFHPGASLGDMSWLIYKNRLQLNPQMQEKWSLYKDITTTHGFNCRTYVDDASKQVVITLEGTQADKEGSSFYFSKDVLSDLEIGAGVIPPQVREGYEEFKVLIQEIGQDFGKDYGLSVAGHSLGGALAQMMAGMYYLDTGVALPALAESGPGMLRQLKIYAMQQLIDGEEIHLPTGQTISLADMNYVKRLDQAKAIANTLCAEDFSNIVNVLTEGDPVGAVNYDADPGKDGHVGVSFVVPYFLTSRELLMDERYESLKKWQEMGIGTPENMPNTPLGILAGLDGLELTRVDRHEPEQAISLWAGDLVQWDPAYPDKAWTGSDLTLPEETVFGSAKDDVITASKRASLVLAGDGNDVIKAGDGGNFLSGGNGNDSIYGGAGDDYLAGDVGNDTLYGGAGNDILYGGAGNDFLDGEEGDDLLFGGAGNDTLVWSGGNDVLFGQEGDDLYIVKDGVVGSAQIKWERNYTNFGSDTVKFEGKLSENSNLLFNFTDEIRFYDMKWMQDGNDILMTDPLGDVNASVTFKDAFQVFAQNSGQIDFKFTNGNLYKDDLYFHVQGGRELHAANDALYTGNFFVGSQYDDVFYAGKGDDLIFAGAGADRFIFDEGFGTTRIIGGDADDEVSFSNLFDSTAYTIGQQGNDLVIGKQDSADGLTQSLVFSDWYASDDRVNKFTFGSDSYRVSGSGFEKISF